MDNKHSALYFGATRDHWWNLDQLELCVRRFGLGEAKRVLDVGSGVGHWSRLIARALGTPIELVGIDREPAWVEEAQKRADALASPATFTYMQSTAESLPFPDASFDLVTCQTVLIHLADPRKALAEMARVLRPGGRLLLAEPDNQAGVFAYAGAEPEQDIDALLREARFRMLCERGKARLGLGFNSLGARLPGLLDPAAFALLDVVTCDRTTLVVPPYATEPEREQIREARDYLERGIYCWPRPEAQRYFEAGGGADFDVEYAFGLERDRARLAEIDAGLFASVTATVLYLLCAERR